MDEILISVVMPVYNGEKYLKAAIDSILNQSYTNFEYIIINDGSTDSSESIILSYTDARIIYIKQVNLGIGPSLHKGCILSRGKYIARMDADDIAFNDRFDLELKYLETHHDTVLVSSAVKYINKYGDDIGRSFPYTSDYAIKKKLKSINPICHPSVMMRKNEYIKTIGYLNLQPFEDYLLWLCLSNYGKMHNFSFPLLKYRVLVGSVSNQISTQEKSVLFSSLRKMIKNGDISEQEVAKYNSILKSRQQYNKNESDSEIDHKANERIASFYQDKLYSCLKKIRLSEKNIEKIICTLKNNILIFK